MSMNEGRMISKKIAYSLFSIVGFLFIFICTAEHDLAQNGNIFWTPGYLCKTMVLSLLLGIALGMALCYFLYKFKENGRHRIKLNFEFLKRINETQMTILSFALNVMAWIPAYLAYYPGICSYDTPIQLGQVFEHYMIDHHPIAHTLLFKAAIFVGQRVFGSVNAGMGFYTFCQLAFLAFGFAYGMSTIKRYCGNTAGIILLQIIIMFYPFNVYMALSTTKDTVFTGFFLIMISSLIRSIADNKDTLRISWNDIVMFVSTIGSILFRNNCKYAFLVLMPFVFVVVVWCIKKKRNPKFWSRLFAVMSAGILLGSLIINILFNVTNAEQGDRREMLSMPIQQFSRCMIYHGGINILAEDDSTMDEESRNYINDFLLDESYKEYVPEIADPVKRHTNTYAARYRAGEFIRTYLKLLAEYPGDFINAALMLDAGYLYPDDISHAYVNVEPGKTGRGYIQTYWLEEELAGRGLTKDSKFEWLHEKMENYADANAYMSIPVLKYLFVPGTIFWAYVLLACVLVVYKRNRMLVPIGIIMGYFATLFLGPTVQMRYLFPLMAALPFVAVMGLLNTDTSVMTQDCERAKQ